MYQVVVCGVRVAGPLTREDAEALAERVRVACIGVTVEVWDGGVS